MTSGCLLNKDTHADIKREMSPMSKPWSRFCFAYQLLSPAEPHMTPQQPNLLITNSTPARPLLFYNLFSFFIRCLNNI